MLLAGCGAMTPRTEEPVQPVPQPRGGGYYKDDGPGENPPANLAAIPDAEPRTEPLHRFANRPYQVFGRDYVPLAAPQPYRQRGTASWYGRRFHGQRTSSGEPYDMYAMSAAHPILPVPSYARVTNLANGRSVVVRINDRGPFHAGRVVDLSYAAAWKLGYAEAGSAEVEVESIVPEQTQQASAHYLQVGAFSARENAETLRLRIQRQLAWLTESIQVLLAGNFYRLQIGPYLSAETARSIAERIEIELNLKPLLVIR